MSLLLHDRRAVMGANTPTPHPSVRTIALPPHHKLITLSLSSQMIFNPLGPEVMRHLIYAGNEGQNRLF